MSEKIFFGYRKSENIFLVCEFFYKKFLLPIKIYWAILWGHEFFLDFVGIPYMVTGGVVVGVGYTIMW